MRYFIPEVQQGLDLIVGELKPSEAVSTIIVEQILEYSEELHQNNPYDMIIIDTAPGAHCDRHQARHLWAEVHLENEKDLAM